eukprot:12600_1
MNQKPTKTMAFAVNNNSPFPISNYQITKRTSRKQPPCPECSWIYHPYWTGYGETRQNSSCCPICGFDFHKFYSCGFKLAQYYKDISQEHIPKHISQQIEYQREYKKLKISWDNEEGIKAEISKILSTSVCNSRCSLGCNTINNKTYCNKREIIKLLSLKSLTYYSQKQQKQKQINTCFTNVRDRNNKIAFREKPIIASILEKQNNNQWYNSWKNIKFEERYCTLYGEDKKLYFSSFIVRNGRKISINKKNCIDIRRINKIYIPSKKEIVNKCKNKYEFHIKEIDSGKTHIFRTNKKKITK